MKHDEGRVDLSFRERCQVIGITLGFLLVLGFLAWLAFTYTDPGAALAGISDAFRAGKVRTGLSLCACIVFYVAGLPVGLALSAVGLFQGALGRRTRLTKAILREMDHEEIRKRHERMLKALDAEKELSRTDRVLHSYLPPAVGWGIFLALLALVVAALVWSATRE
jgi:hypothetical protein